VCRATPVNHREHPCLTAPSTAVCGVLWRIGAWRLPLCSREEKRWRGARWAHTAHMREEGTPRLLRHHRRTASSSHATQHDLARPQHWLHTTAKAPARARHLRLLRRHEPLSSQGHTQTRTQRTRPQPPSGRGPMGPLLTTLRPPRLPPASPPRPRPVRPVQAREGHSAPRAPRGSAHLQHSWLK